MSARAAAAILLLLVAAQGFYAVSLQRAFYRESGPFFDSMAYYSQMAQVWQRASEQGVGPALSSAVRGSNVALPWIEVALLARFVPLSTEIAVWMQSFWAALLALSVFLYLVRRRALAPHWALCATLPFLGFRGYFYFNGGLSDFRMDLSFYLLAALTAVWYLDTYETGSVLPWLWTGLFAGLACLNRSLAPAYFAVMFGPLLAWRMLRARDALDPLVNRVAIAAIALAAIAGPYYFINREYLYYYYFATTGDANANLPWSKSIQHFLTAGFVLGIPSAGLLGAALLVRLVAALRESAWTFAAVLRRVDWKVAWLGVAPVVMLASGGAGLNPFVSMPALFGMILFSVLPIAGAPAGRGWIAAAPPLLAAAVAIFNAASAPALHRLGNRDVPPRRSLLQALDLIRGEARDGKVNFAVGFPGQLHFLAFDHIVLYDFGGSLVPAGVREPSGLEITHREAHRFAPTVAEDWAQFTEGATDRERIQYLVRLAGQHLDCILLPTAATLDLIERERTFLFAAYKIRALKEALLATGLWQRRGPVLDMHWGELIEVYGRAGPRPSSGLTPPDSAR